MRKPLLYLFFLLAAAAATTTGLRAQLLPIRNYTTREGLNANSINAILRDSKGMLWVGTYNGVNWYDGARFFQPRMTTRSGQIYVMNFMEDRNHAVWVATWYSGLYKYADGHFTNYMPDTVNISSQVNSITDIKELDSGRYLAGTDHNAWIFDGHRFSLLDPNNALLNQQIHSLLVTRSGDILIGLPQGIAWYRRAGTAFTYAGLLLKGIDINRMAVAGDRAWMSCSKGLYYFPSIGAYLDGSAKTPAFVEEAMAPRQLMSTPVDNVFPSSNDDCWYTEGNIGACLLHKGVSVRHISRDNGLPSSFVKAVYPDAEGITWIGTEYGLAKLTPAGYRFFPMQAAADVEANIIAIEKDTMGTLWLGSYQGIYKMRDGVAHEIKQPGGLSYGFVFNIFRDSRGRCWACTAAGIYTLENDQLQRHNSAVATGISEDASGTLWFSCTDGRILRMDDKGFHEMAQAAIIDERIPGIYHDNQGFLWAGYSLTGIRKFRVVHDSLQLVQRFSQGYGLPLVRSMRGDGKGHLLVGTRTGGLYIFDSTSTPGQPLTMDQGLSGNWIKGIAAGSRDIFLATNNGLDRLEAGHYTSPVRHIPFNDGRVPTEFNTACFQNDTLWLGTARGILEYAPGAQVRDSLPPPVYCMRVVINGRSDSSLTPFTNDITLPLLKYAQNNLSFDFAALTFRDEANVRYRYRLEGLDPDWSPPTDRRYVNYGDLPPGSYRFLVMAGNDDGVWSRTPASVGFTIAAPFWRTPWFLTLCTLAILALAYGLYRIRLNQVLKIERLRQRISTDLHDDIGSTLSSISILSDMALQEEEATRAGTSALAGPTGPPRPTTPASPPLPHADPASPAASTHTNGTPAPVLPVMIKEIRDNSLSLLEKMDDIVWSINPRNDTLESLMLRVRRFGAQLFEARSIEYDIDIEPGIRQLRLRMEHRQNLYLIMKEAIINLVKYSGAGKAHIRVHAVRNQLVVQISDDGAGFSHELARTGNGIINMQNRAKGMKAHLDIDTAPGSGTTVTLTLKIS